MSDLVGASITRIINIPTERVTFHMKEGGRGVAFGGYSTVNDAVDFTTWHPIGKVLGLGMAKTALTSTSDLNLCTTYGVYSIPSNSVADDIFNNSGNIPIADAGTLRVWSGLGSNGTSYICQEYMTYKGVSFRRYYQATGTPPWKPWIQDATINNIQNLVYDAGTQLAGTETLTSLAIGRYEAYSGSIATALQSVSNDNCPTSNNFALWVVNRTSAPRKCMIIIDSTGNMYTRQQTGNTSWGSWKKVTMTTV